MLSPDNEAGRTTDSIMAELVSKFELEAHQYNAIYNAIYRKLKVDGLLCNCGKDDPEAKRKRDDNNEKEKIAAILKFSQTL